MYTLDRTRVAKLLCAFHQDGEASAREPLETMATALNGPGEHKQLVANFLASVGANYRTIDHDYPDNFLSVSPDYGRFLHAIARARKTTRTVEFGTSMGLSTTYLAAAGLADLVDIRAGDAIETQNDMGDEVDLPLMDGAFSLYLLMLKLVDLWLEPGAEILGENAFEPGYLTYVRDDANGYVTFAMSEEGRGNTLTVKVS